MSANRPAISKSPPQPPKVNQRSGSRPKVTDLLRWGRDTKQNWTLQYLPARNWSTVIAWSLLPPAGKKWLASERAVLHAWHAALLKENPNPLTHLVYCSKTNDVGTLRSVHLRNFINYLQQQIDEGAINRPWSRIHAVAAGLFIVIPDIFPRLRSECGA